MGMVSKVVLEEGHLERYYQQCLEQHNQSQGKRDQELKQLKRQLSELRERIEKAT